MEARNDNTFLFWVGVDWATESHQVCVLDSRAKVVFERAVEHSGEAIARLADDLITLAQGDPSTIAVGIEMPHGAIIESLIERGLALFSLNPKQLDRFRDRHTVAGAKDDRRDAFVLADALRTDGPKFRRIRLGDPQLVQLRELSRMHDDLTQEFVALGHRFREQLHRYYPQMLQLGSVYDAPWLWDLWEMAPTPAQARSLSLEKVRALLKDAQIRRIDAPKVLQALCTPALHVAPGVVEACVRHLTYLLARLRLANAQRRQCVKELEALLEQLSAPQEPTEEPARHEHRDARILRSLPGVGTIVGATMLAEAAQVLEERDLSTLRPLCGVAPVTRQSGKSRQVKMRRACNPRLRQAVYHWARLSVRYEVQAKDHYARLRAKGQSHGRALRGVADRLLTLLLAMLKQRTLYDPTRRRPGPASLPTLSQTPEPAAMAA